jgi:hypothetical protein
MIYTICQIQNQPQLVVNEEPHIMDELFWLYWLFHKNVRMNPVQVII